MTAIVFMLELAELLSRPTEEGDKLFADLGTLMEGDIIFAAAVDLYTVDLVRS